MSSRVRPLRRLSQLVFLTGFLVLFGFAGRSLTLHSLGDGAATGWRLPADLFLRADPLLALSAMVSLRQIVLPLLWYALPVVLLSLLFGRVFCGWVCPMGTAIDLCERIGGIRGRRPAPARQTAGGQARQAAGGQALQATSGQVSARTAEGAEAAPPSEVRRSGVLPWRRVKFYLLVALVVTMLLPAAHRSAREPSLSQSLGLSAVYLVDPIALLTRTLTLSGVAPAQWTITFARDVNIVWTYAPQVEKRPWLAAALERAGAALESLARPEPPPHFRLGLLSFAIFLGIVALGSFAPRFWCRNLCPLGALLGVLGKLSPLRLRVSDKCTRCLRCVNECKMGAILKDPKQYRGPECIWCYSCLAVCPERAISVTARRAGSGRQDRLDLERRRLLEGMGIGLAAVLLPKVDWSAKRTQVGERVLTLSSERLIRPPGALPEDAFVTACVRCGECMKVCPTNTLQPAFGEGGLQAVGTPVVVPRMGPCAESCVACGQVCPTRAIPPFRAEEKRWLYIGTANVDRSTCIAWAYGRQCIVCDEACSYDAIYPDVPNPPVGGPRPVVDDRICVGCGECEARCPVEPRGAIRVSSSGDKRHLSRAEQRALRESASPRAQTGEEGAGEEAPLVPRSEGASPLRGVAAPEQDMIDKAPYPNP